MREVILIALSLLLCASAAYKWIKYVESVSQAALTIKGPELKKLRAKKQYSIRG